MVLKNFNYNFIFILILDPHIFTIREEDLYYNHLKY